MNLKEEIYKTIITNCYTEEDKPEDSVIMGDDFDKLANDLTELVKKMGYIPFCEKFCNYCGENKIDTNTSYCLECIEHVMGGGR